ncbi:hypothetical protein Q4503_10135 [Colwellia sp. 6_MG-2023]|jgi:predicted DNA-binding transcriptional regulator AlpA|uniref:helix-turn-helix transcriptional regulator n=1 Tax=Colwellia sp. 6_MG-2023 TaxID=3062676 RepID=UPI0026E17673|nr:hypothetical protein [Colwellia sp. 6_MG-2023]MDO6488059.1 hypothetical protein [Colwellia sp. 6_MG-2023]
MSSIPQLLATKDVCRIFDVTSRTINNWMNSNTKNFPKPAIKGFPNKWRKTDIENYINKDQYDAT